MNYTEYKASQEAKAQQWMEDNKSDLSDVACPDQSYGEKQGYEVLGEILTEIAEAEMGQFWDSESEESAIESCGKFNVHTLAHWRGTQEADYSGKLEGSRFLPAKHETHDKRNARNRAQFGIEWIFNKNGGIKRGLSGATGAAIKLERLNQVKAKLKAAPKRASALERRAAAAAARAKLNQ